MEQESVSAVLPVQLLIWACFWLLTRDENLLSVSINHRGNLERLPTNFSSSPRCFKFVIFLFVIFLFVIFPAFAWDLTYPGILNKLHFENMLKSIQELMHKHENVHQGRTCGGTPPSVPKALLGLIHLKEKKEALLPVWDCSCIVQFFEGVERHSCVSSWLTQTAFLCFSAACSLHHWGKVTCHWWLKPIATVKLPWHISCILALELGLVCLLLYFQEMRFFSLLWSMEVLPPKNMP